MRLSMEQIHAAVKNPEWQKFRESLKGKTTRNKLKALEEYLTPAPPVDEGDVSTTYPYVRVMNYLNALARGGQIAPVDKTRPVIHNVRNARILK